jgi:hypothetical protein
LHRYDEVRAVFKARITEVLDGYLKEHWDGREASGDWYSVRCPLHEDRNASCSLSKNSGQLNCHGGCGRLKLFEWWAQFRGLDDEQEGLKDMAGILGVEESSGSPTGRPNKSGQITKVTESLHRQWIHDLWEDPFHQPLRDELAARGFSRRHLEDYELGAVKTRTTSRLTFPYVQDGTLINRCKSWTPSGNPRWQWHGDKNVDCIGLWPRDEPPPGEDVLIAEGEWDALAARELAKWPIYAYAWNGGAGQSIEAHQVHFNMGGRRVFICFDLDTWQGPDPDEAFVPHDQKRAEFLHRRAAMIKMARVLEDLGADVYILTVPLDPKVDYKADLRDWISKSDTANFDEIPCISLADAMAELRKVTEVEDLGSALEVPGKAVKLKVQLSSQGNEDNYLNLAMSIISCNQDQGEMCKTCPVAKGISSIDWMDAKSSLEGDRVRASNFMVRGRLKNFDGVVAHDMLGVSQGCKAFRVDHQPEPGFRKEAWWLANEKGNDVFAMVRSMKEHQLVPGDEIEVEAIPTMTIGDPISFLSVHAYKYLDPQSFRLAPEEAADLDAFSPNNRDLEDSKYFILERIYDLVSNVTGIYGDDSLLMHQTVLMVLMSSLWVNDRHGEPLRGWGDAAIIGRQGSGKSKVLKNLHSHFGAEGAYIEATPTNWSAAGITIGYEQRNVNSKQMRPKPGVFPKNNGRLVMIDEFHSLGATNAWSTDEFVANLQSARSDGLMSAFKIGGHVKLKAAVRFITVSNNSPDAKDYRCREIMDLYRKPEQVRRLDTAMWIERYDGPKSLDDPPPHIWTKARCERLMKRAWALQPGDILFEEDAERKIDEFIEKWSDVYRCAIDEIPIFSGAEKEQSLRRMSVSVANMCFSHPEGDPNKCLVTDVHVTIAAKWFEETWSNLDYRRFAEDCSRKAELVNEIECEQLLLKWGVVQESTGIVRVNMNEILNTLDMISHDSGISMGRARQIIGKLQEGQRVDDEALQWQKRGEINNLWFIAKDGRSKFGKMMLTQQGRALLDAMRYWCQNAELYTPRVEALMRSDIEDMMPMSKWDEANSDLR